MKDREMLNELIDKKEIELSSANINDVDGKYLGGVIKLEKRIAGYLEGE